MSRETILRMVEFNPQDQAESDAFLKRVSQCNTPEEVREVIDQVRVLLAPPADGGKP